MDFLRSLFARKQIQEDTVTTYEDIIRMTLRSWAKQEEQYKQDYLSTLPEEILLKIVGYLLPNVGPVHLRAHLLNYKGMQFDPSIGVMVQRPVPLTGLEINSTNIASVSKRFSKLVSEVLYRDRWFQVRFGSSVKVEQSSINADEELVHGARMRGRWARLVATNAGAIRPMSPMDCLKLLLHYTPAQELLTHVRFILDDVSMVTGLGSPRFLQVLQRAKGLREVDIMIDMEMIPLVMYYLHRSMRKLEGELKHVRNITLGDKGPDKHPEAHEAITLLAASLLERNKQWAELSGNSDAVTKEMNKTDAVKKEIGKSDEVTKEEDKSDAVTKEIDESDKGTLAATSCQDGSNGEA